MEAFRQYNRAAQEEKDLREMLDGTLEPDMRALCQEEFSQVKKNHGGSGAPAEDPAAAQGSQR